MKRKKIKTLEALAKGKLVMLHPSNVQQGKFQPSFLQFEGYLDLFTTIESLINVCILASQGDAYSPPHVKDHNSDIRITLELANQLLPFEEGEFLDEAYKIFIKKS